jgi:hypothetical protein
MFEKQQTWQVVFAKAKELIAFVIKTPRLTASFS